MQASYGTTTPTTPAQGYNAATSTSALAVGQTFALFGSATKTLATGTSYEISADPATSAAGATVTIVSVPPAGSNSATLRIKVPNLGIDQDVVLNNTAAAIIAAGPLSGAHLYVEGNTTSFDYLAYGAWHVYDSGETVLQNGSPFIAGFVTPTSGMPRSGSATYSGATRGEVIIADGPRSTTTAVLRGNGQLTANFAANTVAGALTNMQSIRPEGLVAWNNVALNGTISGSGLTGTATVSSTVAANPLALASGATGTIAGSFYGPRADEVGLVWTLQDSNKSIAIGLFGGRQVAP